MLWEWSDVALSPRHFLGSPRGFGEQGDIGKISKGTLANFWEQGNKIGKITVRKHSERVWEHGNIGHFWKGTREQGPPPPWETIFRPPLSEFSGSVPAV